MERLKDIKSYDMSSKLKNNEFLYDTVSVKWKGKVDISSSMEMKNKVEKQSLLISAIQTLIYRYSREETFTILWRVDNLPVIPINANITKETSINDLININRKVIGRLFSLDLSSEEVLIDKKLKTKNIKSLITYQSNTLEKLNDNEEICRDIFDFNIYIKEECQEKLEIRLNHRVYKKEQLRYSVKHIEGIIRQGLVNPNEKVISVSFLTEEEEKLLSKINYTDIKFPSEKSVCELFEDQVRDNGKNIAIEYERIKIDYETLNKRANKLARYIKKMNLKNNIIGLCIPRSIEMIVSIMGIIKAGCIYLPLDPLYPKNRLEFMEKDADASLILTNSDHKYLFSNFCGEILCLDTNELIEMEEDDNLETYPKSEDTMFISYTSGSTGKPKGVKISHKGLNRLVVNNSFMNISQDEIFLNISSIAFDASLLEIFGGILNGGKVLIYPPETPSINEITKIVSSSRVSVLWLTSGLFNQLNDQHFNDLKGLKYLITGGDILSVKQAKKAKENLKETKLINGYGPTENTTFSCCFEVNDKSLEMESIPIGLPISNTKVYVFDDNMQQLPPNIPGTLFVGGDGLCNGYLNRENLNRQKFVANPLNKYELLYNTGDIVHILNDGNLIFHGRNDSQIKLRGYRIELGEIEYYLENYPGIKQAVAKTITLDNQYRKVIAYVDHEIEGFNQSEIKRFLADRIPDYMIPSIVIRINRFPLTPNGKVDKEALPIPTNINMENSVLGVKMSSTEREIYEVWRDVLGISDFGIDDNFISLGGDSLQATEIIIRINNLFNKNIKLKDFLKNPTIHTVIKLIDSEVNSSNKKMNLKHVKRN